MDSSKIWAAGQHDGAETARDHIFEGYDAPTGGQDEWYEFLVNCAGSDCVREIFGTTQPSEQAIRLYEAACQAAYEAEFVA